jgi:hypothetical protein
MITKSIVWRSVGAVDPLSLVEARNQAHHALQLPAKAASAFVPFRENYSHLNFGWVDHHSAFVSHDIPTDQGVVQFGIRLADLTLLILLEGTIHNSYPMHSQTHQTAQTWLLSQAEGFGLPIEKFPNNPPSSIPDHPVASGAAYDLESHAEAMAEFCNYYGNANLVLATIREAYLDVHPGPNEIRMWPHHFDIAVLVSLEEGDSETAKAFGFGFEPGDQTCEQPYFYTYPWPRSQRPDSLPELASLGEWTDPGMWLGTWLKGEEIVKIPAAQQQVKVEAYLREGAEKCRIVALKHS